MTDGITINLRKDEAIVLSDWLWRLEQSGRFPGEHPAEQTVLSRIQGQLESTLVEPFMPNYKATVEEARRSVEAT